MMLGKGGVINLSTKQKINTRSSTVAELVAVNDAIGLILWTRLFLTVQGFTVKDNVVFQDNQSAMLLEKNDKRSSGKQTRHLDIRYFFVTDNIKQGNISVQYCPTEEMVADFFTKPLQGRLFKLFRALVMNLSGDDAIGHTVGTQECVEAVKVKDMENHEECSSPSGQRTYAEVAKSGSEQLDSK